MHDLTPKYHIEYSRFAGTFGKLDSPSLQVNHESWIPTVCWSEVTDGFQGTGGQSGYVGQRRLTK